MTPRFFAETPPPMFFAETLPPMTVAEELQLRADQLKVACWVNHVPRQPEEECLLVRRLNLDYQQQTFSIKMLTPAGNLFLRWWLFGTIIGPGLAKWNDRQESVGPVIAMLEEAALGAKELDI